MAFISSCPSLTNTATGQPPLTQLRRAYRQPVALRNVRRPLSVSMCSGGNEPDKTESVPSGMTQEWAEAIRRLRSAIPSASFSDADKALETSDGDEMVALGMLTDASKTDKQKLRELAAAQGGPNRVSALREAQMRRVATGSARDFFKGYVEVAGQHVDQGYVDNDSDAMGKFVDGVKGLFGGNKKDNS